MVSAGRLGETVEFTCPQCGQVASVSQVQGDRCPGCGFEFKWFAPNEERTAGDYLAALTKRTHYLPLSPGLGFIVAHE